MLEKFSEISQSRVPLSNGSSKPTNGSTKTANGMNGNGHLPASNGKDKGHKKFTTETEGKILKDKKKDFLKFRMVYNG